MSSTETYYFEQPIDNSNLQLFLTFLVYYFGSICHRPDRHFNICWFNMFDSNPEIQIGI